MLLLMLILLVRSISPASAFQVLKIGRLAPFCLGNQNLAFDLRQLTVLWLWSMRDLAFPRTMLALQPIADKMAQIQRRIRVQQAKRLQSKSSGA